MGAAIFLAIGRRDSLQKFPGQCHFPEVWAPDIEQLRRETADAVTIWQQSDYQVCCCAHAHIWESLPPKHIY
jgi:hypothetical protein